jgi:hypothetical protein
VKFIVAKVLSDDYSFKAYKEFVQVLFGDMVIQNTMLTMKRIKL